LLHGLSSTITLPQTSNTTANQSIFVIQRDQLFLFLTHKPSSSSIATTSSLTSSPHHSITSTLPIDSSATRPTQQDMISFPNHGDSSNTESSQQMHTPPLQRSSSIASHDKTSSFRQAHLRGTTLYTFHFLLFFISVEQSTSIAHWQAEKQDTDDARSLFFFCFSGVHSRSQCSILAVFPLVSSNFFPYPMELATRPEDWQDISNTPSASSAFHELTAPSPSFLFPFVITLVFFWNWFFHGFGVGFF
jgi:hypothetical protein